jgi:hypothetical protein
MDLFTVIESNGKILYHGTSSNVLNIKNKPLWLAHNEKNAESYGKNVFFCKLKKPVKLLDVSHSLFHQDFMYKVNNFTAPEISNAKLFPLLALGLPDFKTQIDVVGHQQLGMYPPNVDKNPNFNKQLFELIETFVSLFENKHRLSIQGSISTDKLMMESLMKLYPEYDGYICKNYWPSYHHGGFLMPETCIFHPNDIVELVGLKGGNNTKTKKSKKQLPKHKSQKKEIVEKPGWRRNAFGGMTFKMDDFCKDTGIPFEDMIRF